MKILHVAPYFYPAWAYGGIPRVVYELSRELARRGHEVVVYTTDVLDEDRRCPHSGKETVVNGVRVRYFKNVSNSLAYHYQAFLPLGMRKIVKKTISDFDVIHLHGHRNFLNNIVHHYAVRSGKPYIFSGHGTVPIIERRHVSKKVFDVLFGSRILRDAARFIAVSRHEICQYNMMNIDRARVEMKYNGIDVHTFEKLPPPGRFKTRYGLSTERLILYLGKITPRKGIDVLVRSFSGLNRTNAVLVIAGNDMGYRSSIESIIRDAGITRNVLFTGLLTGKNKLAAFQDADVLVYPAIHEIFGLVPFESLLCGTPVIVTDDCGCGEIIGKENVGYLTRYNDVAGLRDKIAYVLDHPEEARNRVRRAVEFIKAELSWDRIVLDYESVYEKNIISWNKR